MKFRNFLLPVLFGALLTSCNMPDLDEDTEDKLEDLEDDVEDFVEDFVEEYEEGFNDTYENSQDTINSILEYTEQNKLGLENTSYTLVAKGSENKRTVSQSTIQMDKTNFKFKMVSSFKDKKNGITYTKGVHADKNKVKSYDFFEGFNPALNTDTYLNEKDRATKFHRAIIPVTGDSNIDTFTEELLDYEITDLSTLILGIFATPGSISEKFGEVTTGFKLKNTDPDYLQIQVSKKDDDDKDVVVAKFTYNSNLLTSVYATNLFEDFKGKISLDFSYSMPNITFDYNI